jgi:hypothetical protein
MRGKKLITPFRVIGKIEKTKSVCHIHFHFEVNFYHIEENENISL